MLLRHKKPVPAGSRQSCVNPFDPPSAVPLGLYQMPLITSTLTAMRLHHSKQAATQRKPYATTNQPQLGCWPLATQAPCANKAVLLHLCRSL